MSGIEPTSNRPGGVNGTQGPTSKSVSAPGAASPVEGSYGANAESRGHFSERKNAEAREAFGKGDYFSNALRHFISAPGKISLVGDSAEQTTGNSKDTFTKTSPQPRSIKQRYEFPISPEAEALIKLYNGYLEKNQAPLAPAGSGIRGMFGAIMSRMTQRSTAAEPLQRSGFVPPTKDAFDPHKQQLELFVEVLVVFQADTLQDLRENIANNKISAAELGRSVASNGGLPYQKEKTGAYNPDNSTFHGDKTSAAFWIPGEVGKRLDDLPLAHAEALVAAAGLIAEIQKTQDVRKHAQFAVRP